MTIYSHSRLSCFEQCPLKFRFKYIDKIRPEIYQGIEAFMGSRVHEALEKLYKDLKYQKLNAVEELINFLREEWKKNWNNEIIIVKQDYTQENYLKMAEKFIKDYYEKYHPFDDSTTISTEDRVLIDLGEDYQLQGFIDRLSFNDGVYEVHDYKTNSSLPIQDYLDQDRQLALYSIAVKNRYKDADKIRLIWHFLAFNKELDSVRTDQELENLRKETVKLIKRIEDCKEFKARESKLCDWCEFKPICVNFAHLYKIDQLSSNKYLEDDGVKLVNKYADLKVKEKEIKDELDLLKEAVLEFAKRNGVEVVYGSDNKIRINIKEDIKFPGKNDAGHEELVSLLKEMEKWESVSDIDVFKLKRVMKDFNREELERLKSFEKPYIMKILRLGKK